MRRRPPPQWRFAVVGAALAIALWPIALTALASLGITPSTPRTPRLEAYLEIGAASLAFPPKLAASFALALATACLTLAVAAPAAFALARSTSSLRPALALGLAAMSGVPLVAYLMPLRETLRLLHLQGTFAGVMLAETGLYAPFAAYLLYGQWRQSPHEAELAARLEGATGLQVLWHVALPGIAAGAAATGAVVFAQSWNATLLPLVAGGAGTVPVAFVDVFAFERDLEWPTAAAAIAASLLPLLALAVLARGPLEHLGLRGGDGETP